MPNTITTRYDILPPLTYLSPKSRLIAEAMYRSNEEIREIEDVPSERLPLRTYPPKRKTAACVRTKYSRDEYTHPEDRLPKNKR